MVSYYEPQSSSILSMLDWAGVSHALPYVEASCATESEAEEDGGTLIRGIEPVAPVN